MVRFDVAMLYSVACEFAEMQQTSMHILVEL